MNLVNLSVLKRAGNVGRRRWGLTWSAARRAASCTLLVIVIAAGCKDDTKPSSSTSESESSDPPTRSPLRVLVLDDEPLAAALERQWRATAEVSIEVTTSSSAETLASGQEKLGVDAVIYPAGLIGELAERRLVIAIPDEALDGNKFDARDVLDLARFREVTWGEKAFAIPLGSPQLVLLYRADIFERLGLQPPQTWTEYNRLVKVLSQRADLGDLAPAPDQPWSGTLEPLGPGWAGSTLLARAAAYARHRSHYSALFDFKSMEPLIDGPPFVKALEELVVVAKALGEFGLSGTPHTVRRQFLAGQSAMALTWPSNGVESASKSSDAKGQDASSDSAKTFDVGCSQLPGATEVYNFREGQWETRSSQDGLHVPLLGVAGRLGSVTRESPRARSALNLLVLLSSAEWSVQVLNQSQGTTMFRVRHLSAPQAWTDAGLGAEFARQYSQVVHDTHKSSATLDSLRIPGRGEYLEALDSAVGAAIRGDVTPAEALRGAADKWREITNRYGVEKQRRAYRRSLGIEDD